MPISPHVPLSQHAQMYMPPLIDLGSPSSAFISVASSSAVTQPSYPTRPKSRSPPSRAPPKAYQPHSSPPKPPRHHLDESDIDRFAMLFALATPPATLTQTADSNEQSLSSRLSQSLSRPTQHRRTRTESSTDSDFGPFVSVPPHQDPLTSPPGLKSMTQPSEDADSLTGLAEPSQHESTGKARNVGLDYFGQFTTTAKVASEQKRKHQDDPLYFLAAQMDDPPPSHRWTTLDLLSEEPELQDDLAYTTPASNEPLPSLSSLAGLPRTGTALPPRLSGSASPPSASSPNASGVSLPLSVGLDKVQGSGQEDGRMKERELNRERHSASPSRATLSRISSNLVSTFLSGGSKHARSGTLSSSSTTGTHPSSHPTLSSIYPNHSSFSLMSHRGSPFVSTPYMPPSGAPGFTGDRNWDKGFYDALQRDKESGTVDTIGLGGEMECANGDSAHGSGSDLLNGSWKDEYNAGDGGGLGRSGSIGDVKGKSKSTNGKVRVKGINLCGRREGTLEVLTEDVANPLRVHLPALIRLSRNWTLLYSIDQHGISLNTLYSRCEPRIPCQAEPNPPSGALLVVKDSFDGVLCGPDFIAFGGGDGHYGLYIDSTLLDGSSAPCPTFDNPVLCAQPLSQMGASKGKTDVPFECVGLEVWGIGPG
ncbi:hypothetical protein EDD15DRAFT_2301126 [Pisolithus albus]|nr:hypothetical protein EDD15DRAFT_2301126 [Pisolithus albus]